MSIIIRATRPALLGGRRIETGETAKVSALEAAMAIDSGRFELVHDGDAGEVLAAKRADARRAVQQAGRPWHPPAVTPPWERVA